MKLTKHQFDLLVFLEKQHKKPTQREIVAALGKSLGTVNKILNECSILGYVSDSVLTEKGRHALEPYRVKRAIFIAAGFGSRMVPITLNTPKPLVRVNGVRIIDTLLDAVFAAEIEEVYIVRGYLGEQFDQLLYKYPTLKFIENPLYNEANNISSISCARHLLQNTYILEGDLLLYNPDLIQKYQYGSNYLAIPMEKTDDWCFYTTGGYVSKMSIGGVNCYQMVGISYWSEEDGKRLCEHVQKVYEMPGGKERYWDQVPLEYYIRDYKIGVRECRREDIVEIDTFRELKAIDKAYE